ncbi:MULTISPECIES: phosphate-starvation-inducible protein PsiE [Limosilactobacillus]|uniref:Protein PsiE n=2 Tax=Limosilactobacillus TaxID=2742598 RepID=A0A839H7E6_9LACO|nr:MULTISPECIES: phosphate-starvation-inducible protein PsiE [Limosilactobacillus]MRH46733.1 phosphate-starvation-inducible protein PsiE [Limosilactobacillus reuteri]MBB1122427.1 phosphate-starvation-inducible protein PsiE [Limosilactobacillus albertensis]MCD7121057.1 phosphate-starvation-inducible protein PsiE [Limosilactobacillus albertensis]MCD7123222.1 phosphate-starvation-inducible protein PsiE [Limosilactobacillus caviae]GGI63876.1 phosphate-starvation-inducible protein PsiE [Limosilacto
MKRIYELATKFSHALRLFTILALAILGTVLTVLLFTEIFSLIPLMIAGNTDHVIFKILDRVIVFFLFFSFITMIIAALKHHGHIAVDFLLSLGIMALIRGLIAAHGQPYEILTSSIAILLLIIGMVTLKHFMK